MRSGPTLKYQLAIDIQVSSTTSRFDSFSSSRPDSLAWDGRADSSSARAIAGENLRMGRLRVWDGASRRGARRRVDECPWTDRAASRGASVRDVEHERPAFAGNDEAARLVVERDAIENV